MPRLPRIHLEGALFLITCRGQEEEAIFKDKADMQMYLELVNRYKKQHGFRLYAYTLLPDRLHLLVEPAESGTVSQIMHDLHSAYTKYFNGRYQRRGHLFESRFKSSLVEKAKYLVDATRHVHRQEPAEKALSSFDVYVLREEGREAAAAVSMDDEIRETLAFLKNRDDRAQYGRYCLEPAAGETAELEKSFKRSSVIGSPEFVERVQNRIKEHAEILKEESSPAPARPNRVLLFLFGALVILATSTSIYLYVSRQKMEAQYAQLIRRMEAQASSGVLSEERPAPSPDGKPAPAGGTS